MEPQEQTIISISRPTPVWATWMFRIIFLLTTALAVVVAGDPDFTDKTKFKVLLYSKALDVVIWGIGRALGVKKKDFEEDEQ